MKFQKILSTTIIGAGLLLTTYGAMAAETLLRKNDSAQPYGMAGCGVGSLLIDKNEKWPQVGSALINNIVSYVGISQSFAITSGTSNCVQPTAAVAQEQEVFIHANLASLTKEAAQGDGEHISALAQVFGCPHEEFAKFSQSHYKDIYSVNQPDAVLQSYRKEVRADQYLAKSCQKVI